MVTGGSRAQGVSAGFVTGGVFDGLFGLFSLMIDRRCFGARRPVKTWFLMAS